MIRRLSFMHRPVLLALATAAVVATAGCANSTYLSAASSMRIEVDVYKGPLSNSADVQKGQLSALLRATRSSVNHVDGLLIDSMCRIGCIRGDGQIDFGAPGESLPAPWLKAPYTSPWPRDREFWFRPSAEFCANRGIPQRRILEKAPTYPPKDNPARYEHYNSPLSQEAGAGQGLSATDNFMNNRLDADSRFPESDGYTYRICPVYISMREQIRNLKEASCRSAQTLAGESSDVCEDVDLWLATVDKPFGFRDAGRVSSPAVKRLSAKAADLRRDAAESLQEPRRALVQEAEELDRKIRDSGDAATLLLALTDAKAALIDVKAEPKWSSTISDFNKTAASLAGRSVGTVSAGTSFADVDKLVTDAEALQRQSADLAKLVSGIRAPLDAVVAAIKVAKQAPAGKDLPLAAKQRQLDAELASVAKLTHSSSGLELQARILVDVLKPVVATHRTPTSNPRSLSAEDIAKANRALAKIQKIAKDVQGIRGNPAPAPDMLDDVTKEIAALASAMRAKASTAGVDALKKQRDGVLTALKSLDGTAGHLAALPDEQAEADAEQADRDIASYAGIAELATGFRVLATTISYGLASTPPRDGRLRIDMLKVANLSAEFANQFTARASALSLQTGEDGIDRRALPTGLYLRDSQPTAFLDAYKWHEAATELEGDEKSRDRIQIAKRLFADDNWSRVNEVYASGSGDVSMAFIRDDIGNWNLKQFSSDASKLTAAYTKLGLDLVGKVAGLATGGGATALAKANGALAVAQNVQAGTAADSEQRSAALIANLDLSATRADLSRSLTAIRDTLRKDVARIRDNQRPDDPATPLCPVPPETDEAACRAKLEAEAVADAKVKVDAVVQQYELLIDAFQRVAAVPPAAAGPTSTPVSTGR